MVQLQLNIDPKKVTLQHAMGKLIPIHSSRQQALPIVQKYVINELLPALKQKGPVTIRPAEFGRSSHVYFIEGLQSTPLILRGETDKRAMRRRVTGHELLLQHGFNVPEIVYQDWRSSVKRDYGFFFIVETYIAGQFFNDVPDSETAATRLGQMLARMHQLTCWQYGWPGEFRWPGSIVAWIKFRNKIHNQLSSYSKRNKKTSTIISKWLNEQPLGAWFPKPRLTTGGFISSNLIVDKKFEVFIIDLARVRYAFAARDIAQIKFVLTKYDQKARTAFLR
ncbi:MAG: hypothetical protein B1H12_10240, partial [Desulfobacteraceae bacterium 4484_190.2]